MQRNEAELLFVFALLALPIGWAIEWGFGAQARDAVAAHGWPTAPGVVTESRVLQGRSSTVPSPFVRYDYRIAGELHSGSGVHLSIAQFSGEPAHEVVARYPPGKEVQVHYDPERPETCTLEQTELDFWDHLLLWTGKILRWAGAAFVLVGLVQHRASVRGSRPEESALGSGPS